MDWLEEEVFGEEAGENPKERAKAAVPR